jgi:rubrerythrin
MEATSDGSLNRRSFLKGAALVAVGSATAGILAACTTGAAGETVVGTTYDNLLTALQGETNATTKYSAFAKVARSEGYDQVARLFECTADAEKIHIELEYALATGIKADTKRPVGDTPPDAASDANLIAGAKGEIYETSDMYPKFIEKAKEEGNTQAVTVFTRAKLAEGYHAELYLDIYNTLKTPDASKYYLCPVCGYIHKGDAEKRSCPICQTSFSLFTAY